MNKKDKIEEKSVVNEPSVKYETSKPTIDNSIPSYVLEDYQVGMDQYAKGEYISAEEFLNKISSPMSIADLNERIDKSEDDFRNGRYKTSTELIAKYERRV